MTKGRKMIYARGNENRKQQQDQLHDTYRQEGELGELRNLADAMHPVPLPTPPEGETEAAAEERALRWSEFLDDLHDFQGAYQLVMPHIKWERQRRAERSMPLTGSVVMLRSLKSEVVTYIIQSVYPSAGTDARWRE